jgi:hypothetical protein
MLKIDGVPPQLEGQLCEELLCQQYWHKGRLEDEADVVLLKVADVWHQLYFDDGVVHWATQDEELGPGGDERDGMFAYPIVDLGADLGVRGQRIAGCATEDTGEGERVTLFFDNGPRVDFVNRGDRTSIRHRVRGAEGRSNG